MAYNDINNPPFPPKGEVAIWNGTEWVCVPEPSPIPPKPSAPGDWEWNGSAWVDVTPPPPPTPTPDQVTAGTINTAVSYLQTIAYLTTSEMGQHITPESRQEVTDYIHAVANILATAQTKYGTGEAYAPTFPPMPTAVPQLGGDGVAPVIRFVAGE